MKTFLKLSGKKLLKLLKKNYNSLRKKSYLIIMKIYIFVDLFFFYRKKYQYRFRILFLKSD